MLSGLNFLKDQRDTMSQAKSAMDALPGIIAQIGSLGDTLRNLPPAPVILGAASRMIGDAIAKQMIERGPSPAFLARCESLGITDGEAREIHTLLVAEVNA